MTTSVKIALIFMISSIVQAQTNFESLKVEKTKLSTKFSETPTSYRDGYLYYYKGVSDDLLDNKEYNIFRTKSENEKITNKIEQIDDKLNTRYSEGQIAFDEEKKLVYVTRNSYTKEEVARKKLVNNPLEVIIYEEINNQYVFKERFAFNDTNASVGFPCFSELTKRLYFSSKKSTGKGGYDLYYCELNSQNQFSNVVELGSNINGKGDEFYPTIKQGVLYYSSFNSDKYKSDFDIYYVTEMGLTRGEKPKVLPSPINSEGDDLAITFIDGQTGYFASNRESFPAKDNDIYYFDFGSPIIDKNEFSLLLAIEKDKKDKLTLSNFKVLDKTTNQELMKIIVSDGVIVENVKEGTVYEVWFDAALNFKNFQIGPYAKIVQTDVFKEEKIDLTEVIKVDKDLDKVMTEKLSEKEKLNQFIAITPTTVYFDLNSYSLTDVFKKELNSLVIAFGKNIEESICSSCYFLLEGYADKSGSKGYNDQISLKRAEAVKKYLNSLGVPNENIKVKGLGSSNNTIKDQENRKVTITPKSS